MLTADQTELLAAAADAWPLPAPVAAETLMAGNGAARRLYRQFVAQRRRLRALPVHAAPPAVLSVVMARVAPATPARRRSAGRRMMPYAVAASLFVGIAITSFYASRTGQGGAVVVAVVPTEPEPPKVVAVAPAPPRLPPVPLPAPDLVPPPRPVAESTAALSPEPTAPPPAVSAAAVRGAPAPFADVRIRLPMLGPIAEFDRPDLLARLRAEADGEGIYRLDLFGRDPSALAERLQAAAKGVGLAVVADALTQELARRKIAAPMAAYTEALSRDEFTRFASALAESERAAAADGVAHAYPARTVESREFRDLFGADAPSPWRGKSAPATGPPLTARTLDQVTSALKGGPGPKSLLLLATPPGARRSAAPSPREVRDFFAAPWMLAGPATFPLIVTIRAAGP